MGQQAAQREPTFLGYFALGDGDKNTQARLRRQHIVIAVVLSLLVHIKSNPEKVSRLIKEEIVFHLAQFFALRTNLFNMPPGAAGSFLGNFERRTYLFKPCNTFAIGRRPVGMGLFLPIVDKPAKLFE